MQSLGGEGVCQKKETGDLSQKGSAGPGGGGSNWWGTLKKKTKGGQQPGQTPKQLRMGENLWVWLMKKAEKEPHGKSLGGELGSYGGRLRDDPKEKKTDSEVQNRAGRQTPENSVWATEVKTRFDNCRQTV